ncbi:MAG: UDP-3-O-acyl-N-acetylglucosamine deacetylase [Holosporales bacterium]|jgi:UDP-3-O-[3-hydroxymyristoyl] N-acetylglucosamine deacetylase|nr:UDP-3-O-acyl-N-acetylglucosamine deacetylase [Holosporales bacterium]
MNTKLRSEATIGAIALFSGVGVHGGNKSTIKILPAPENLGIVFKRIDIVDKNPYISLSPESVVECNLCTCIANNDGVTVSVVEHLLAAFRITGITNALIEVNSDEIPIMDGSAIEFVNEIKKIGIVRQRPFVQGIVIKKEVVAEFQGGKIAIYPSKKCNVTVNLNYDRINPIVGKYNKYMFDMSGDLSELACARTFGWVEDQELIRSRGFGLGASEKNTIGIGPGGTILNTGGLRNQAEFVMHKSLDLLGDLFVLGCDIIGRIECLNPSHALNNLLLKTLMMEIENHEMGAEQQERYDFMTEPYLLGANLV